MRANPNLLIEKHAKITEMRTETDKARLEQLMVTLGRVTRGPGAIYLTGGASAVLLAWRKMTVDVDMKLDPEPAGIFDALPKLKDDLVCCPVIMIGASRRIFCSWQGASTPCSGLYTRRSNAARGKKDQRIMKHYYGTAHQISISNWLRPTTLSRRCRIGRNAAFSSRDMAKSIFIITISTVRPWRKSNDSTRGIKRTSRT